MRELRIRRLGYKETVPAPEGPIQLGAHKYELVSARDGAVVSVTRGARTRTRTRGV